MGPAQPESRRWFSPFRYLASGALENDHFVHLAPAHQILLHGAWPVRDFADPGMPLQYLASAVAGWLFGPSLWSDVLVNAALLAAAAAVTLLLVQRATGSLAIAVVAAAMQVAARPRLYNAPKLFILTVAIARFSWYSSRRSSSPGSTANVFSFASRRGAIVIAAAGVASIGQRRVSADEVLRRPIVVTERLTRWPWTRVLPTPDLLPLAMYANRCTSPADRVLAGWFAPDFAVISRRGFAGGHAAWLPGYYNSTADQDHTIARLARESVPLLLLDDEFAGAWPHVFRHLMTRPYHRVAAMSIQGRRVAMWIDSSRRAVGVDEETRLPCFGS